MRACTSLPIRPSLLSSHESEHLRQSAASTSLSPFAAHYRPGAHPLQSAASTSLSPFAVQAHIHFNLQRALYCRPTQHTTVLAHIHQSQRCCIYDIAEPFICVLVSPILRASLFVLVLGILNALQLHNLPSSSSFFDNTITRLHCTSTASVYRGLHSRPHQHATSAADTDNSTSSWRIQHSAGTSLDKEKGYWNWTGHTCSFRALMGNG